MFYLPIAILAYLLNSIAVTVDKFLLVKAIPDPILYVFYFSAISLLAILAIPFVSLPSFTVLTIASVSTVFWTSGAYLMFKALKTGHLQRVIPVIGAITPLILLAMAAPTKAVSTQQVLAVLLMVSGLILLTIYDWKGVLTKLELILEIGSATLFALSYYLLRMAFEKGDFLSVFVWSKPILLPLGVVLLIIPVSRKKILPFLHPTTRNIQSKNFLLFGFGQISAGISELLLTFSISLANPAIVNSFQGVKYIFLLLFSLILAKKFPAVFKFPNSSKLQVLQTIGILFVVLGIYLLATA